MLISTGFPRVDPTEGSFSGMSSASLSVKVFSSCTAPCGIRIWTPYFSTLPIIVSAEPIAAVIGSSRTTPLEPPEPEHEDRTIEITKSIGIKTFSLNFFTHIPPTTL